MDYKQEDIERAQRELVEHIGKHYPGMPFMLLINSSDSTKCCHSRGAYLQDPMQAIRQLSDTAMQIAQGVINQQFELMKMAQNQQIASMIEQNKGKLVN
jgi:hypothetical protein